MTMLAPAQTQAQTQAHHALGQRHPIGQRHRIITPTAPRFCDMNYVYNPPTEAYPSDTATFPHASHLAVGTQIFITYRGVSINFTRRRNSWVNNEGATYDDEGMTVFMASAAKSGTIRIV